MKQGTATIIFVFIAATFLASPKPANAELIGKNYAQINIPGSGGWDILAFFNENELHSCGAITIDKVAGMQEVLLEHIGFDWQIGLNRGDTGNYQGRIFFLGSVRHTLSYEPVGPSAFPMMAFLKSSIVAELKNGNSFILEDRAGDQIEFSLSGSSAAMAKTEECVRNKGRQGTTQQRQQPQPRVAQQPQPRRQNNVALKPQLSGTWVWSDPVKNSENNLIVSTIRMTGNNTLNYCYGVFCWDVNFSTNANNDINFSTNGTDHFTFYDDGPNAVHGEFWEFGNTQAHPDARVDFR